MSICKWSKEAMISDRDWESEAARETMAESEAKSEGTSGDGKEKLERKSAIAEER